MCIRDSSWALDRRFTPAMDEATRAAKYDRWGKAVAATMSGAQVPLEELADIKLCLLYTSRCV